MKKFWKIMLIIVLVPVLLLGGCYYLLVGTSERVYTNLNNYEKDLQAIKNAANFMPSLDSLTGYENIEYTYKVTCYSHLAGFYSDAYALFVTYDDAQYEAKKQEALGSYEFLQEPIKRSDDTYELPVAEFAYKDYTMKVVPDEDYIDFCACKSFLLLGFNDHKRTIAYLYYYDFDIDYIAQVGEDLEEEMCRLVDEAFAWAG